MTTTLGPSKQLFTPEGRLVIAQKLGLIASCEIGFFLTAPEGPLITEEQAFRMLVGQQEALCDRAEAVIDAVLRQVSHGNFPGVRMQISNMDVILTRLIKAREKDKRPRPKQC